MKRRCTRWVSIRGSLTVSGKAGSNSVTFRGRLGGRALKPGSYRLAGTVTDRAGNRAAVPRKGFRILR